MQALAYAIQVLQLLVTALPLGSALKTQYDAITASLQKMQSENRDPTPEEWKAVDDLRAFADRATERLIRATPGAVGTLAALQRRNAAMKAQETRLLREILQTQGAILEALREDRHTTHNLLKEITMKLSDILDKVAAEKTVDDSIVALLNSINAQLKDALANQDLDTIQKISDGLDANIKEISDAVTANTSVATDSSGNPAPPTN